jgi:hypothetical protein
MTLAKNAVVLFDLTADRGDWHGAGWGAKNGQAKN